MRGPARFEPICAVPALDESPREISTRSLAAPRAKRLVWLVWLVPALTAGILAAVAVFGAREGSSAPTPATVTPQAAAPAQPAITVQSSPIAVRRFGPLSPGLPDPPVVTARSYLLVNLDTRETLAERDAERPVAIASLTKIATALAALSLGKLDQVVTVSEAAAAEPPNVMGLVAGDRLTLEELLYGLLLDSGNDAAHAIADAVGGEGVLVEKMNQLARDLGLRSTHFANSAGYDDPAAYSTARDLAVLTAFALETSPEFRAIIATERKVLESSPDHGWYGPANINRLLSEYPGAYGVKPGFTDEAGYTLVAAVERGGVDLIAVVLGAQKHFSDAESLLDFGYSLYARPDSPAG